MVRHREGQDQLHLREVRVRVITTRFGEACILLKITLFQFTIICRIRLY